MLDIAISAEAKDAPPEKRKALEDEVVGHCEHDNWSDAMQTCMLDAKTTDDLAACDQFMTADQHAALAKEQADGGGAGSAVAPHAEKPKPTLTPAPASTVMPQDTKRSPAPKNKKGGDPCEGGE